MAGHFFRKIAGSMIKKAAAAVIAKVAAAAMPLILIFLALVIVLATGMSVFSRAGDINGDERIDQFDKKRKETYQKVAGEYTVKETWAKFGIDGESIPSEHLGYLADRDGKDQEHALKWGLMHSINWYYALAKRMGSSDFPDISEKTASELRPYLTYKKSVVIISSKEETTEVPVYLLVAADTFKGIYQYSYRWETRSYGDVSVTKEVLDEVKQDIDYKRFDEYVAKTFGAEKPDENTRNIFFKTMEAFEEKTEKLAWLLKGGKETVKAGKDGSFNELFIEAGEAYGVPWYILKAIAFIESRFDPQAVSEEGAQGLMQIMPATNVDYGVDADGDGRPNPFSPKDAVYTAANYLVKLGWGTKSDETVLGLYYSGKNGVPNLGYARAVLKAAAEYREGSESEYVFPVMARTRNYTSYFGPRKLEGETVRPHEGVDIGADYETPLLAFTSGVIEAIVTGYGGGYGNHLVLLGYDGNKYLYAHMSAKKPFADGIDRGVKVEAGQVIGYVGNTGHSRGPHLHFGVIYGGRTAYSDPLPLLQMARLISN